MDGALRRALVGNGTYLSSCALVSGATSPLAHTHRRKSRAVEVEIAPFAVVSIKLPVDFFFFFHLSLQI